MQAENYSPPDDDLISSKHSNAINTKVFGFLSCPPPPPGVCTALTFVNVGITEWWLELKYTSVDIKWYTLNWRPTYVEVGREVIFRNPKTVFKSHKLCG